MVINELLTPGTKRLVERRIPPPKHFNMAGASGGNVRKKDIMEEETAVSLVKHDLHLTDSETEKEMEWITPAEMKRQRKGNKRPRQPQKLNDGSEDEDIRHKKINTELDARKEVSTQNREQQNSATERGQVSSERRRLYFPNDTQMSFHEQLLWAATLGRKHKHLKPLLKEELNRPYLTVEGDEAVKFLTTEGFQNVIMKVPDHNERYTKVIVYMYPVILEPDFILDDERFVWAKRREVKGEKKNQVIALMKGEEIPERIFISGIGYRKIARYIDQPVLCYKCSRWGHMAWKCQNDFRCRYCGGKHNSLDCGSKIKTGQRITPRCCNCSGEHNAGSMLCEKRPQLCSTQRQNAGEGQHKKPQKEQQPVQGSPPAPPPPPENVWKKRMEQ